MGRIIIAGVETVAGQAIARHASQTHHVEAGPCRPPATSGMTSGAAPASRLQTPSQPTAGAARATDSDVDVVCFCGGAAHSSWDNDFGLFDAEQRALAAWVAIANQASARLVYISSDAVFDGPWIFHDDECHSYAATHLAEQLREWEDIAATAHQHLIIRTNVLGAGAGTYVSLLLSCLEAGLPARLNARQWSTPLAETAFAQAVTAAIDAHLTGTINVGGAERTTPFRFAAHLANSFALHQTPELQPVTSSPVHECGLRSHCIRQATTWTAPILAETLDQLVEQIDSPALAFAA